MELRNTNPFLESPTDQRSIQVFEALELLYWNDWEAACKFGNEVLQNESMRRISLLQDIKHEFKKDVLGR